MSLYEQAADIAACDRSEFWKRQYEAVISTLSIIAGLPDHVDELSTLQRALASLTPVACAAVSKAPRHGPADLR
jgi:hypothetical protein